MKTVLLCVYLFASALASPKNYEEIDKTSAAQNEPQLKRMYVDPSVTDIWDLIPRITNGVEAEPHSIPYQAYLIVTAIDGLRWLCGGSLISTKHVLTAGHCVNRGISATVYIGAHNIKQQEQTRVAIESKNLIRHEDFNEDIISNDIGIIVLDMPVELNDNIGVIQLPSREEVSNYEGVNARVSGWGRVGGDEPDSPVLLFVNSTVISNFECSQVYYIVTDSQLCTSGHGGVGSCNGDSGGPLIYDNLQIGIVSYGETRCSPGYPSGFTRITSYLDWLEKNTGIKL